MIPDWMVRGATFMICNKPNAEGRVFGILLHVSYVDQEKQRVGVEWRTRGKSWEMPLDDVLARAQSVEPPLIPETAH